MKYVYSSLTLLMVFLLACGSPPEEEVSATPTTIVLVNTPDIEATVEARVEERLAAILAQTPSSTAVPPEPTHTPIPTRTALPASTPLPTKTPLPANTQTPLPSTPTPTSVPLPTETPLPLPTATSIPIDPVPTATQGPTSVGGNISSDALWKANESPFTLTGPLTVAQGTRLEIEPGATVDLNGHFITVEGELRAIGEPNNLIEFVGLSPTEDGNYVAFAPSSSPWVEATSEGSVIQHAVFTTNTARTKGDAAIKVDGSAPLLSHLEVTNFRSTGIYLHGPAILEHSRVCDNLDWGVLVTDSAIIRNNEICNNRVFGIRLTSGSALITENIIYNNNWEDIDLGGGISIELSLSSTGAPEVTLNNITGNQGFGIRVLGERVGATTIITQNSFTDNEGFHARIGKTPRNVNMARNWWGSGDKEVIEELLHDEDFEFGLESIIYLPRLNGPPEGLPVLGE